jgi:hypothetical protein
MELVAESLMSGTKTAKGRTRGRWSAVAVNKIVATVSQVFADAQRH